MDNYCPVDGSVTGKLPNSSAEDVENAYIAARSAFPSWSQTPLDERSRILIRISELLESKLQDLAEAESMDNGKPVSVG